MLLDERHKQLLIDDLCRLIRIPSRSSTTGGEEGELQSVVADNMRKLGARIRTFEADDIPGFHQHPLCFGPDRQYENRPTVIGEIGPEDGPALLLLAHSDTVQITSPEAWTFDPFCGAIHKSRICGLGASDDKWGIATMLTLMRSLQESGSQLRKKVIFASTIDEENGVGNGILLLMLAGLQAETALYLDGAMMKIYIGNLGGSNLFLRPKDPWDEDRRSLHAKQLDQACQEFCKYRASSFDQPFFRDNIRREKSIVLNQRKDDQGDFFLLPFYTVPGDDRKRICRELEEMVSSALGTDSSCYHLSYREPWFEPGLNDRDTPLVGYFSDAVSQITGQEASVTTNVKQDRFILTNYAKIPTISFGPHRLYSEISGRGACHQPDEYLSVANLWQGCQIAWSAVWRWMQEG